VTAKAHAFLIAGCGPAGLAAALLLHRSGHGVRLIDQFDAPRPIGSGLMIQPTGLMVLDALGLGDAVRVCGARIDRLEGRSVPSDRLALGVRYAAMTPDAHAHGLHRGVLFRILLDAVTAAGIPIENERKVTTGSLHGLCTGDEILIDALGSHSPIAMRLQPGLDRSPLPYGALWATVDWPGGDFPENALSQRYRAAREMAGVMPIGAMTPGGARKAAFFWSLRTDALPAWQAAGIDAWRRDVVALWPALGPIVLQLRAEDLTFARYDHHTMARPWSSAGSIQVIHIGDAAHATSPQLGQGANMALLDALALSTAADQTETAARIGPAYAAMRRWHVRSFQLASWFLTPFYQSDAPWIAGLRDRLFTPLTQLPVIDGLVARLVTGLLLPPLGRAAPPAALSAPATVAQVAPAPDLRHTT
jgi:salicylate hydroxylase